jgi:phosphoribosylanthranilate isomerase
MTARVKICGIRRMTDALLAAELGAAAVGFIFWPRSPRFVDPYRARTIAAALPPWVTPIGVFVDQPADYVRGVAGLVKLGAVQLHGSEAIADYTNVHHRLIKAVPVSKGFSLAALTGIPDRVTVLLDAHDPVRRGGTGRTIEWTVAATVARLRPTILSGGLNADNVVAAIEQVHPSAIDVSSGVESSPGVKDHGAMRALFAALEHHDEPRATTHD